MFNSKEVEIKVGLFVVAGVSLLMLGILTLGAQSSMFTLKNTYYAHFPAVDGLVQGAKVMIGGIQVGIVDEVDFDPEKRDVRVELEINRKYSEWVRGDSSVELATQGVLGDKYVMLSAGSMEQPLLSAGAAIPSKSPQNISEFITKGDQLMIRLNSIAGNLDHFIKGMTANNRHEQIFQGMAQTSKNLSLASDRLNQEMQNIRIKSTVQNLNSILEKVNSGVGTLGALVNDPSLYDDAKSLLGGANRNRLIRNLVRQTVKEGAEKEAQKP